MIRDKIKNFIKSIAKETFDEMQPKQDEFESFSLPEIDRNKYLAMSIQKTHKDLIPSLPKGGAMDSCCDTSRLQQAYNITNPINDIIYTFFATQGFIGFQACAILTQNWLINKACLQPTKDAIRPDYELSYVRTDEEELDKDFLSKIIDLSNDRKGFNIKETCRVFAEKKRQFGQILAYPIVDDADYANPFNIDGIKPNSYKGITVVDPIWYEPILDEEAISDPTSLRYFKPTWFRLPDGKKIHSSWCIFGKNGEVPDVLKPTYRWGGYPIPQLIYKRAYAAEKVANEAPMLAQSKRLLVADVNVQGYLANPSKEQEKLKALSMFRDNWGIMTKRPGDSVQQIDTSLTDLDEVIMTQYQLVAAAAGIPATKLLETQPKGFNSTGDYEDDQYKLTLVSIQEDDFVPILDMHYKLLTMSKYGIKRDYTINFVEIDTPTEKERVEINNMKAQTVATYLQAGIITEEEARANLIKDPDSGFNDITDELPEDEFNFSNESEEQEGNGKTPQDPFASNSTDEWFTVHPNGKEHEGRPVYAEGGESKADAIKRRFGSAGKGENPNPQNNKNNTKSSNVHKNVSDYENKNHSLKYEKGAVFDDNGNTIIEFSGQEHEIFISDEDMKKLEGKTFTHNHPNGSPISKDDIISGFLHGKLKELRATTPQGKTYSLKPNSNNTDDLTKKLVAIYNEIPKKAARLFEEKCRREIIAGNMSIDFYRYNRDNLFKVYTYQAYDKFLENHASEYGFDYKKEE